MHIYKTLVYFEDGPIRREPVDTVIIADQKWLVPEWIDTPATKETRPARIILLDDLLLQSMGHSDGVDWLLSKPIPRSVFVGDLLPTPGTFVVHHEPDWPPIEA